MIVTMPSGDTLEMSNLDARALRDRLSDQLQRDDMSEGQQAATGLLEHLSLRRHELGLAGLAGFKLWSPFLDSLRAGFTADNLKCVIDYDADIVSRDRARATYLTPTNICWASSLTERCAKAQEWQAHGQADNRCVMAPADELRQRLQVEFTGRRYKDEEWAVSAQSLPVVDKLEMDQALDWLLKNYAPGVDRKPPPTSVLFKAIKYACRPALPAAPVAPVAPAVPVATAEDVAGIVAAWKIGQAE